MSELAVVRTEDLRIALQHVEVSIDMGVATEYDKSAYARLLVDAMQAPENIPPEHAATVYGCLAEPCWRSTRPEGSTCTCRYCEARRAIFPGGSPHFPTHRVDTPAD